MLGAAVVWYLMATSPEVKRHEKKTRLPVVEVEVLQPSDYQVLVESQGTVTPRTQTTLVAEVRGKLTKVADNFRVGGMFARGDVLVTIDDRDYRNARTIAAAELAKARVVLNQEEARAEQARSDWERLGNGKPASDLVLRKPQLDSAKAAVAAAAARLAQADTDLERTRIRAPYAGRVLEKQADLGQFVTPGTALGKIYAVDYVEISLPLSPWQLAELELPDQPGERGESVSQPEVVLHAGKHQWRGRVVRTTGAIDTRTRQQFVIVQVDRPYAPEAAGQGPLQIGQFVTAAIKGRVLQQVFVLPRTAVREDDSIVTIDQQDALHQRHIDPVWRSEDEVVVAEGLEPGLQLVVTPVGYMPEGTKVKVLAEEEDAKAALSSQKSSESATGPEG